MDEIAVLIDELTAATTRLQRSVSAMADAGTALSEPGDLPGWTRAHVLVHLSRNSDGLRNLLLAARTGEPVLMYASPETRGADIEVGTLRPSSVLFDDLMASATRFVVETHAMPSGAWQSAVAFTSGAPNPPSISAQRVVELRIEEVEVHHVDLAVGYGFPDTPRPLATRLIKDFAARRANQGMDLQLEIEGETVIAGCSDAPVVICDSVPVMLNWLAGRTAERAPNLVGTRPLPDLPPLS